MVFKHREPCKIQIRHLQPMNNPTNVLMLGGAKRVSFARLLIEAGRHAGKDIQIFSYEIIPTVPIASVGKVIVGKRWNDPEILEHLDDTIRHNGIGIVLPFVDGAVEICSQLKERHPDVFIPVSPFEIAHAMFDKAKAAEIFQKEKFDIPKTYTPDECQYPAILKPRTGSASKGIIVAQKPDDLPESTLLNGYLMQEYIAEREEYTVDCYVSTISHRACCIVPRLRISTSGGEVDRTETHRIPRLIVASEHILQQLGLEGPVTLQFLHDKTTGRFLLMEINPRLGGGVVCSILAGADIPTMILAEADGKEAQQMDKWRDHALMARYFNEVMF